MHRFFGGDDEIGHFRTQGDDDAGKPAANLRERRVFNSIPGGVHTWVPGIQFAINQGERNLPSLLKLCSMPAFRYPLLHAGWRSTHTSVLFFFGFQER